MLDKYAGRHLNCIN